MAPNPFENRLSDLPLILCGPIVRRVEQEDVSVWVALKAKREVELSIWEEEKTAAGKKKFIGNSEALASSGKIASLEVGKHLFIALVHLKGIALEPGRGYAYNLSFYGGAQPEDLSSLGLLLDQEPGENGQLPYFKQLALGYDSNKLPSFVLPASDIKDLKIAHGSCRKDGGKGKDALAALDDLIRGTVLQEQRLHRPQALFLTGDQIYANSLSEQLLPFITDAGNTLIGKTETAPILEEHKKREEEKIHYYPIDQAHFPAGWRKDFLVRQAFFTGAGGSHLCSFGEYCASYLFYWSNVPWDKELLDFSSWWENIYFPHLEQVRKITEQVYANASEKDRKYQLENIDGIRLLFSRLEALRDAYPKLGLKWIGTLEDILKYKDNEGEKASEALERINRQLKQEQENINKKIKELETGIERSNNKSRAGPEEEIEALREKIAEIELFMTLKDWVAGVENAAASYEKGKKRVEDFRSYLPKVRRALANISTLMIFDDHDVTDDWFITGEWRKKTLTFPLGLTVNRNALLAFALFQAAGNRPDYFDYHTKKNKGGKLLAMIPDLVAKMPAQAAKADDPFIAQVNTIDPLLWSDIKTGSKVEWHFDLKLGPTHVFALDTRVNRDYSAGDHLPPGLITEKSLKKQLAFSKVPHDLEFVIVVSAVPVLGLSTMEDVGQMVGSRAVDFSVWAAKAKDYVTRDDRSPLDYEDLKGRFSLDLEAWSFNDKAYERLLAHLFSRKRVLFLSGDVHYGTASSLDYWKKGAAKPARFIQFTSSAMRNEKGPTITNVAMSGFAQQVLSEGLDQAFLERTKFGWPKKKGIHFSRPLPLKWRKILWKEPVLIPAWQFPKDITLAGETVPEWVWRLQVAYDTRPDEERPKGIVRPLTRDTAASPVPEDLPPVFQRHIHQMHQRMSRRVNFNANIGVVRFDRDSDQKLYAIQDLYAYHPTEDKAEDPQAYQNYRILFEPTDQAPPTLNSDYAAD